jgi:hypothetical protein
MQQGLDLYFQLAHKHGLIDRVKPLKMLDSLAEASLKS